MIVFPEKKHEIKNYNQSENAFLPRFVNIPLCEEFNTVCECIVKPGELVKEGQVIAVSSDHKSAPIHSSIPGKIVEITKQNSPNGRIEPAVKIALSGSFSYLGKMIPEKDSDYFSPLNVKKIIEENGIINTFNIRKPVNLSNQIEKSYGFNLVVRFFDEDPTCFTDSLTAKFFAEQLSEGTKIIAKAINAKKVICVINSKVENKKELKNRFDQSVSFLELSDTKYPLSFKNKIISVFNKDSKNLLKLTKNDLFVDCSTVFEVYNSVVFGTPSINKNVHFSGNCLKASCLLNVKLGTSIKDIISQIGGLTKEPKQVIINGNIHGTNVSSLDIPITKYVKSVYVISKKHSSDLNVFDCINCGNCRRACTNYVLPDYIFNHAINFDSFNEDEVAMISRCIDCSSCNMVCPSRLPLSQMINSLKEKYQL